MSVAGRPFLMFSSIGFSLPAVVWFRLVFLGGIGARTGPGDRPGRGGASSDAASGSFRRQAW